MKRILMILIAMVMSFTMANAQTVEHSTLLQNTYIGVNGGIITPMVPHNGNSFMYEFNPIFGLELGKNVTPVVGFSIEGQCIPYFNANQIDVLKTNVVGSAKLNLTNWFSSYNGQPKAFEILLVPGIGWMHDFRPTATDPNYITYNTGFEFDFNLGKARAWQINIKPNVIWKCENGSMGFYKKKADIRASLGLTYKFGYRNLQGNRTHNFTIAQNGVNEEDYNELAQKYNELLNEDRVDTVVVETIIEKVIEKTVVKPSDAMIIFEKGKYTVSDVGINTIKEFADVIKNASDYKVKVIGSADSATGSKDKNNKLAWERANAVAKELINNGVNVVNTEVVIDVNKDSNLSRCAIVIAE